tara:strand:+ start:866 stop:1111 length:246 start_codon:yes stop_codon:yes gene_type:complete
MKLSSNSTVSVDALKGALVTNEHGAEFKCIGLAINISPTNLLEPILHVEEYDGEGELMEGTIGVPLTNLKNWTIQLQPHDQ